MRGIRKRFTKWYVKKGYRFGYDFSECEIIGDDFFKLPLGMPRAFWVCPWWVKPLLIFFSPSVYTAVAWGEEIIKGFEEGMKEGAKHERL